MSFWDRFRRPKASPRRLLRNYAGANTGRLFADWLAGSSKSADAELRPALRTLRERSRDLERNSDYGRRFIEMIKSNVIGSQGIRLQCRARTDGGDLDVPGNDLVESAFRTWGQDCSIDGRLTWTQAQSLFVQTVARDGECLVRLLRKPTNPYGFSIQIIEADRLDEEMNGKTRNGEVIRMGIQMSEWERPTAYWLYKDHPGASDLTRPELDHIEIPADEMLHAFRKDRPSQHRGVPWMSTAMARMRLLDVYEESEVVASRIGASKMGFFTSELDPESYTGDDLDEHTPVNEVSPGQFEQLPPGMDFKEFAPDHPTSAFADFSKSILRGIASGLGVSYVALANNLEGVSYSSVRAGEMADRDHWKMIQQFVIDEFCTPIYRAWLQSAMTTGALALPVNKFDKFSQAAAWTPRSFPYVDPQREMQSQILGLKSGVLSLADVQAHYGRDVEELFTQLNQEATLAAGMGVDYDFAPYGRQVSTFMNEPEQQPTTQEG